MYVLKNVFVCFVFIIISVIIFKIKERGLLEIGDLFYFDMDISVCKLN